MKGRKPKPTHLKIVGGNPGRRPLNLREPWPSEPIGAPPEWMTARQQSIWADAVASAPHGLLRDLDASALATWVIEYDIVQRSVMLQAKLDARGGAELLMKTAQGHMRQSPYVQAIRQHTLVMMRAAAELGFTPSARTRVQLEHGNAEKDPLEKFLAG